ncbi:Starch-binding associating with outer membrane [Cyclobacterium xiamenense]|uniref:Starch-binding associating with outer membrane n=1 Tax=Cyclobacterium xiamenense TaxID=1297121 RepID=A0A1H6XKA0_9BACT|nr:SusD/RagB family nutrient-binding outer membrane lipoprotein [Cyclobacterium xiamenense]SEJ29518.1 Starch-binding associating with outer membrane [Cyclobacterium xiamenense]
MKHIFDFRKIALFVFGLVLFTGCDEKLDEININPFGIEPSDANPNLLMPTVLASAAQSYVNLGYNDLAGAVQHTQKNGWYSGHNFYDWSSRSWAGWYDILRTNELMIRRGEDLENNFFQGMGLTMKSFVFGNITDLWGDAPYTDALKGDQGGEEFQYPKFDSQEVIYDGIISDLQQAVQLLGSASPNGVNAGNDLYYNGDVGNWRRFANSLLLRYYMRLSEKKPDVARAGVEAIYSSGIYIQDPSQDATLDYTGGASDEWLSRHVRLDPDGFQRYQACQTFIDQLTGTMDPRLTVWFDSVRVQWVPDETLTTATEDFIRANGEPLAVVTYPYDDFVELYSDVKFTRRFNPNMADYNTDLYVGLPPAITVPESYNGNPSPGQGTQNQHVSQLAPIYSTAGAPGDILKARIISAAEVSFIFAEAALKGWNVGDAETHYNKGIEQSLDTWGRGGTYADFISQPDIAFNNSLEQILTQKWVASWTAAAESFADYRRTGFPALEAGPLSPQPEVALRFQYGSDEYNNNSTNINSALDRLEITPFSGNFGADSQWSKPWLYQGTNVPF